MSVDPADVKEIFLEAVTLDSGVERKNFLNDRCRSDADLFARVNALLVANDQALANVGTVSLDGVKGSTFNSNSSNRDQGTKTVGPCTKDVIGAILGGKYKLLEEIGDGGMGTVWMAEQTEPVRRQVAVKLIKPGMDSKQVLARFEAERQALAMMDHPNIAKVHDAGTTADGRPYFVMELVKGVPLTKYCDEHKLTPRERLELFVPVCQAIQHAHQKGIIHRDIKPSNVLVALYDDRPVPKVIDFGVAKATGIQLTEQTLHTGFGAVVGTVEYMSPEQASFNQLDVDTRSDIYSLGVLLYELLTGTTPLTRRHIKGAALLEVLRLVREEETPKPSTRLSSTDELPSIAAVRGTEPTRLSKLVRGDLDWIVMKALEKDRSRRYETANGFAADVQRYLADETVVASPPSAGYRFRKFAKRNKGPLITVGSVLMALLVGLIGTVLSLLEARVQFHDAQQGKLKAQESAAEANAVLTFFEKRILSAARPKGQGNGLGNTVTIREALDAAEPGISDAFAGQPLAEASIRRVLGLTYWHAGDYEKAISQHERALDLRRTLLESDHPDILQSLTNLGQAYQSAGRLNEALSLQEETLQRKQTILGATHSDTLWAMNRLAETYMALGRAKEALPLYEHQVDIARQTLGHDHTDTLIYMDKVAVAYRRLGRYREAITLFEQTYKLYESKLPPDHHDRLATMSNLGFSYADVGRWDESIAWLHKVLNIDKKALGENHPERLIHLHNLGTVYRDAGRLDDAKPYLEEAYNRHVKKLGLNHQISLFFAISLASLYRDLGRLDEALSLFQETRRHQAIKLPANHPHKRLLLNQMGDCLIRMKKLSEAEQVLQECLTMHTQADPSSWWISYTNGQLGQLALARKEWEKAEPLLLNAYRGLIASKEQMQAKYWAMPNVLAKLLAEQYDARGMREQADVWRNKQH
jgi:serine/threonine protein kinase/tetratricopeptide (TPR) repeat protein